jgi:hypothetical protein
VHRNRVTSRSHSARVGLAPFLGLVAVLAACGPSDLPTEAERPPTRDPRLDALGGASADAARQAIASILADHDRRYTAAFIELLRAAEVGIASPAVGEASARALEALTGLELGDDWPAWVTWYAGSDLEPPPGFIGWKGELLAGIDENFADLLYPGAPSTVRAEEIVWGGVAFEGIPALDRPATLAASEAVGLDPGEPVLGVELGGEARAYPLRILDWHEMVNDEVGGVAFSLAYCTLCGAGIAYRATAPGGAVYDFGSSGLLMRSNKLMVDRQTRSLWNQLTGRPVLGRLAESELRLERLPLVLTTWGDWLERHPKTRVLSFDTGTRRPYHPGAAYGGYFASPGTMFPVRSHSTKLAPKTRIYAIEIDGVPKAYPVDVLTEHRVVHDTVNGVELVLLTARDAITVEGRSVRGGPVTYEAGAPVRAYRAQGLAFTWKEGALLDGSGRAWSLEESALVGPDGERLPREPGFLAYWFGWNAYHPRGLLYEIRP